MRRVGEAVYDDQGREVAHRLHGWWYRRSTDALGLPEDVPVDPAEAQELDEVPKGAGK